MDFTPVEYPPPPIDLEWPGVYGPGRLGAFCELVPRATYDPRHPKCGGCGRFLPVEWQHCGWCGCDCSVCTPWY